MKAERRELEQRIRRFAVAVIRATTGVPPTVANQVVVRQVVKAATSVGANFREAGRAESRNDFVHKLAIAEKEIAETEYWLELITDLQIVPEDSLAPLVKECDELLRILVSSLRSAKQRGDSIQEDACDYELVEPPD